MSYNIVKLSHYLAWISPYMDSKPYKRKDFIILLEEFLNKNLAKELDYFYKKDSDFYRESLRKLKNKGKINDFVPSLNLKEIKLN